MTVLVSAVLPAENEGDKVRIKNYLKNKQTTKPRTGHIALFSVRADSLTPINHPDYSLEKILYPNAVCLIPLALSLRDKMYFIFSF